MIIRQKTNCCCESNNFIKLESPRSKKPKKLIIEWKRLVNDGKTCFRCGNTEVELDKGIEIVRNCAKNLNIEVEVVKSEISLEEFRKNPLISNQIMINGKLLEEWLNASTGSSLCCDVCESNECRTIQIDGKIYETITRELIIKGSLIAMTHIL
ncbi:MAG: DUF2703 domain-containing protein [Ignavibacteria bacterium]|nr:DUF2703 domain-containing protein [Ignavibacteria bacterium]